MCAPPPKGMASGVEGLVEIVICLAEKWRPQRKRKKRKWTKKKKRYPVELGDEGMLEIERNGRGKSQSQGRHGDDHSSTNKRYHVGNEEVLLMLTRTRTVHSARS